MTKNAMSDVVAAASRLPRKVARAISPRTVGRKTKESFTKFVAQLFVENELLAASMRKGQKDAKGKLIMPLTNDQLKAAVIHEFSHEETTVASFECGNQSVEKLRNEYHQGLLARSNFPEDMPGRPKIWSFRYNEQGQVVHPTSRKGDRLLTNGDIRELPKRFKLRDCNGKKTDTPAVRETVEEVMKRLGRNPRKAKDDSATE